MKRFRTVAPGVIGAVCILAGILLVGGAVARATTDPAAPAKDHVQKACPAACEKCVKPEGANAHCPQMKSGGRAESGEREYMRDLDRAPGVMPAPQVAGVPPALNDQPGGLAWPGW